MQAEAFLTDLRKKLAHHIAQKISFSSFATGKSDALIATVRNQVLQKLNEDGIPLKDEVVDDLVQQLVAGMSDIKFTNPVREAPPADIMQKWQHDLAAYLARELDDALFADDRRANLAQNIALLAYRWQGAEQPGMDADTLLLLIEAMCEKMHVTPPALEPLANELPPPAASPPAAPPAAAPEDEELEEILPPPKKAAAPALLPNPAALRSVAAARAAPSSKRLTEERRPRSTATLKIPLAAFTGEMKRELLLHLGNSIDRDVIASGDLESAQNHILEHIESYCESRRLMITDTEIDKIINEILNGGGMEFQL